MTYPVGSPRHSLLSLLLPADNWPRMGLAGRGRRGSSFTWGLGAKKALKATWSPTPDLLVSSVTHAWEDMGHSILGAAEGVWELSS